MDRKPQLNQAYSNIEIMEMRASERKMMFERAFNDLLSLRNQRDTAGMDQSRSSFETREETVLIGTVFRLRRLGVTPSEYHFTFQESEDKERLDVTLRRGETHSLSYEIEIGRLRPQDQTDLLLATIKSYRNKRSGKGGKNHTKNPY